MPEKPGVHIVSIDFGLCHSDNDGDLDLVVGQSHDGDLNVFVGASRQDLQRHNFLFLNDGTGVFTDATAAFGIEEFGAYVAFGDYGEDGFVDLLHASSPDHLGTQPARLFCSGIHG